MNITVNSNSGIYQTGNQINAGGRQVISELSANPESAVISSDKLTLLKAGDVFSGQIMEMNDDGTVSIMLGNNASLKAQLSSDLSVNIGQMLSFQVKGASSSSITLTPLYANLDTNSPVAKALTAANLPVTAESAKMVTAMMERGLPIDTGSLQEMAKDAASFPMADPVSIVQMKEIGIPLTEDNVAQFEAYKEGQYQISESVGSLSEGFVQIARESLQVNQSVINTFLPEQTPEIAVAVEQAINGNSAQLMSLMAAKDAAPVPVNNSIPQGEVISDVAAALKTEEIAEIGKENIAPETSGSEMAEEKGGEKASLSEQKTEIKAGTEAVPKEEIASEQTNTVKDSPSPLPDASMRQSGAITDDSVKLLGTDGTKQIADIMTKAGFPEEVTEKIASGDITTKKLMDIVRTVIEKGTESTDNPALKEAARELIKSEPYGFLLRNEITRQFLLEPANVADADKVKEYYERIVRQADNAINMLKSMGKGDTALAEGMQNLKSNVDFINGMNNVMTYVQLPLKLNDSAQHGDLYVYTNKKNLAKKDGNCTALLHLDMEHLGPVDVHVTMRDFDKINTHFILQSEELLDFIAEHLHELDGSLEKRGYHMHSDVALNKEPKSVPEIMFNKGSNAKLIQKTSFDVRA